MNQPRTLPAAIAMGEPVVAYSARAARTLDSVPAAVLISQLWFLSEGGSRLVNETIDGLERSTGLSATQQRGARAKLSAAGWIQETHTRSNGRTRLTVAVRAERILADVRAPLPGEETSLAGVMKPDSAESQNLTLQERTKIQEREEDPEAPTKETSPGALATVGQALALPEKPKAREYRVAFGEMTMRDALATIAKLDTEAAAGWNTEAMEALMRSLTALRVGDSTTHQRMPFATYSGADCALVRRKLSAMKPSEIAKAVVGASHVDTWARERGLSLAQILAHADRYAAVFENRKVRPDKERASHVFLEVYKHASKLAVADSERWSGVRDRMSFLSAAELLDEARAMAAAVDQVRVPRGDAPLSLRLNLPEVRRESA